jgi:TatD DNase family protein
MARKREKGFPADPRPLPIPVVDNHTHLDSIPRFVERSSFEAAADGSDQWAWSPTNVPSVSDQIERAAAAGVDRIVQVGCDLPAARWTSDVVSQHPTLLGAVAIHPNEAVLHAHAHDVGPDGLEPHYGRRHDTSLDDAIAEIASLARANPRIRAIGETGMDLFRSGPRGAAVQREAFRAHIAIAKELDLALQIHDRDAHREVIDVLLADGAPERTVFHCYSGDAEMAQVLADNGWYMSVAGPISYPANEYLRDALRVIPEHLILAETDAPYLTAHPFRGQPNAPYAVAHTIWAMAEVRLTPIEALCQRISDNSERVYQGW